MNRGKKGVAIALLLMAAGAALSAFAPEERFYHVFFQAFAVAVVILSLSLSMKDVLIILLLSCSAIWSFGFLGMLSMMGQLMAETAALVALSLVLGWYEFSFNVEKGKYSAIIDYKSKQNEELKKQVDALHAENHAATEELKAYRKMFAE